MKPTIDITITDRDGHYAEPLDANFNPYEVVVNGETVCTSEQIEELKDGNAKLRELVIDMLQWMTCPRPCTRCERYHYPEGCEFDIRRRELGIEP